MRIIRRSNNCFAMNMTIIMKPQCPSPSRIRTGDFPTAAAGGGRPSVYFTSCQSFFYSSFMLIIFNHSSSWLECFIKPRVSSSFARGFRVRRVIQGEGRSRFSVGENRKSFQRLVLDDCYFIGRLDTHSWVSIKFSCPDWGQFIQLLCNLEKNKMFYYSFARVSKTNKFQVEIPGGP